MANNFYSPVIGLRTFLWKTGNIFWFQLLKCEYFLVSLVQTEYKTFEDVISDFGNHRSTFFTRQLIDRLIVLCSLDYMYYFLVFLLHLKLQLNCIIRYSPVIIKLLTCLCTEKCLAFIVITAQNILSFSSDKKSCKYLLLGGWNQWSVLTFFIIQLSILFPVNFVYMLYHCFVGMLCTVAAGNTTFCLVVECHIDLNHMLIGSWSWYKHHCTLRVVM